jgi:ribosomal protein S19
MYKSKQSWKIPYVNLKWNFRFVKNIDNLKGAVYERKYIIPKYLISEKVKIHDGKDLKSFLVKPNMVGHKFGEFVPTKVRGKVMFEHRSLKKKKKDRKKKKR